jgi:hypothetical protein
MNTEKEYIKYIYNTLGSQDYPETKVEMTLYPDATLDEVVEKFEDFLRGIGYCFEGRRLDIVKNYD